MNTQRRDRVRALQLYRQALDVASDDDTTATGKLLVEMADLLRNESRRGGGWRLQALTDLSELPNYETGWWRGGSSSGAPVTGRR